MYRIWYSTESFADYIIDNTVLKDKIITKNKIYESDANNPKNFHTMPDHIRKILYLDACDLIVEKDNEPNFSIEVTTEAGTGHNAFQRFARIAASAENNVPAFYIYPDATIITRKNSSPVWDKINPLIFRALESVMSIYEIPALLYYFPTDYCNYPDEPILSKHFTHKGLCYDNDVITYPGCPDKNASSMVQMFKAINEVIKNTENYGVKDGRKKLISNIVIREQRNYMQNQFSIKSNGKNPREMSPLTAVIEIDTSILLNYLSKYENLNYKLGELLSSRQKTLIYQVNAKFRGDPYPGALAAIDYLLCREGHTYEDRKYNLVLLFGKLVIDSKNQNFVIKNEKQSTIQDLCKDVKSCLKHNLLKYEYNELESKDIPRYFMQLRYGSTYSKVKHIRVFSYFSDAILFPDGALWRDA